VLEALQPKVLAVGQAFHQVFKTFRQWWVGVEKSAGMIKMKAKLAILAILLVSVFLIGCTSTQSSGYAAYNQPQQQGQYVGGGCGVAPNADYETTPVEALEPEDSAL